MRRLVISMTWMACAGLLTACGGQSGADCSDLCFELVDACAYEAFPDRASCLQGCEYNAEQGADIEGQLGCVLDAACDTFAIVECEHAYGVE